jgi:hypothetical protein
MDGSQTIEKASEPQIQKVGETMMACRKDLKKLERQRKRFAGVFVRFGKKSAFRGPDKTTILLGDIVSLETGSVVTEHLWFNETEGFKALYPLTPGEVLEFDARVKSYEKGYRGHIEEKAIYAPLPSRDYKLSHPTKIQRRAVNS